MFSSSDHRYFINYFNTFLNPSMRKSYKSKKLRYGAVFLLHNFRFKIFEDLKVKRDLHYKKNFSVFQEYEFWQFLQQVDVQSLHLQD